MKVVDDNDNEVADGELGEIVLRGENILKGYFKSPEATATAFRNGWFHTGDVGYRDKDGFFYIVDRKSDMIIRGGENIYPREIDEVLYQHPAVAAAATIGVPDDLYGEEVAAFVVLKDGMRLSEQELISHCTERLADYKCPKSIRIVKDIPKGPTGKLLKRELAKQFYENTLRLIVKPPFSNPRTDKIFILSESTTACLDALMRSTNHAPTSHAAHAPTITTENHLTIQTFGRKTFRWPRGSLRCWGKSPASENSWKE